MTEPPEQLTRTFDALLEAGVALTTAATELGATTDVDVDAVEHLTQSMLLLLDHAENELRYAYGILERPRPVPGPHA